MALDNSSSTLISAFGTDTKPCIQRLVAYFEETRPKQDADLLFMSNMSHSGLAAVLVLIFEQDGKLHALLTTRGKNLRTHGGQTALPGGKMDESDESVLQTARREAFEEVGLPLESPHIHTLGIIHLHMFSQLLVAPVVALLTDNSLLDQLKPSPGEVDHIFSHPLEAVLEPDLSITLVKELVAHSSPHWPYEPLYHYYKDYDIQRLGAGVAYRWHYFRSSASPVTGMTADILIRTAEIAYDKPTTFVRYATGQLKTYEEIIAAHKARAVPY